jgi:hypothetical protein
MIQSLQRGQKIVMFLIGIRIMNLLLLSLSMVLLLVIKVVTLTR